jgi:hypothetical protein
MTKRLKYTKQILMHMLTARNHHSNNDENNINGEGH